MSEREIIDFDDWSIGTIVTKDGVTFYKVVGRKRLDERIKYRLSPVTAEKVNNE